MTETFDAEYVSKLRDEAAAARGALREAQTDLEAMSVSLAGFKRAEMTRAIEAANGTVPLLANPGDLIDRNDDLERFRADDGTPDREAIRDAMRTLGVERPHLRPQGSSADQGPRPEVKYDTPATWQSVLTGTDEGPTPRGETQ